MLKFPENSVLPTLLENLREGVYLTDTHRIITYWNHAAEQITGFSEQEVLGKCCADNILMHVDEDGNSLCKGHCPLAACMKDGKRGCGKIYAHHKDGHRVPVNTVVAPIRDEAGTIIGGLETFIDATSDLASLREAHENGKNELLCPLTGVGSQQYSEETLTSRIAELVSGEELGAVLLVIDEFDQLAKRYGAFAGDIVLKMIARTIIGTLQPSDFIGRWWNNGFLVIKPSERRSSLEQAANRIRVMVERSSRDISKGQLRVTVSGCAGCAASTDTPDSLTKRLEAELRSSGGDGFNKIVLLRT